jgi:hypothetical protein
MDRKENSIMADIPIDELDFEEQPERPDDSWTYNLPEDCDESTKKGKLMTTIDAGGEVWPSDDRPCEHEYTPNVDRTHEWCQKCDSVRVIENEAKAEPLVIGGMSVDSAIDMHLVDCVQCREATERGKPRGLGQHSGHCGTYWHLQLLRANYEGRVNNIVAHTELGDEAPIRGQLE